MTDCARCGDCCDPVYLPGLADRLPSRVTELETWLAAHPEDTRWEAQLAEAQWISAHWHPIGPSDNGRGTLYRCDRFDAEHRRCGAHDDRPPVCRNYPWYGREPGVDGLPLHGRCSYWADIPFTQRPADVRPLIPVMVLRG